MITEAELTGSGIRAMTETGGFSLSFAYEADRGTLLITNAGCAPLEIPLSLEALDHLSRVAACTRRQARVAAELVGANPMVPRHTDA